MFPDKNTDAVVTPKVGDYWHEMFCPYFIIVHIKDKKYTVLSCLSHPGRSDYRKDEPYARIDNNDGTWSFDYSKSMVVSQEWIVKAVTYQDSATSGCCASVVNTPKTQEIVDEWRNYRAMQLLDELKEFGPDATTLVLQGLGK